MSEEQQAQQPLVSESIPEPTAQDRITDIAIDLTNAHGSDDYSGELKSADFYVPDHKTGDSKHPSLKINIPKEEVAEKYKWRAELTFGNQDPSLSTHVLVRKDGTIVASDYANGEPRVLNEQQAKSLLEHLNDIQGNLTPDSQK